MYGAWSGESNHQTGFTKMDCDAVDLTHVRSYTATGLASMFGSNVRELVSLRTRQKILIRTGNFVG